jgi:hypothetical protein
VQQVGFICKIPLSVLYTKHTRSFPHLNNKPKICHIHLTLKGEYHIFVLKSTLFRFSFFFILQLYLTENTIFLHYNYQLLQAVTSLSEANLLNNFNQTGRCPQFLLQFPNTKFHKNPCSGIRAFTDRETG